MVASTDLGWLQSAFDMLIGLFDRMGLRKNFRKTVIIVFQTCWGFWVRKDKAYKFWMTGEGRSYQERQQERATFPECRKDLARGSMANHRQTQHGMVRGGGGQKDDERYGGNNPRNLRMRFLEK